MQSIVKLSIVLKLLKLKQIITLNKIVSICIIDAILDAEYSKAYEENFGIFKFLKSSFPPFESMWSSKSTNTCLSISFNLSTKAPISLVKLHSIAVSSIFA